MDIVFSAIPHSANTKKTQSTTQEQKYKQSENMLIHYISSAITNACNEGRSSCRVFTSQSCFPSQLTAAKVMEHLASPLYQLGYKASIIGDNAIHIEWNKEEEGSPWFDESF